MKKLVCLAFCIVLSGCTSTHVKQLVGHAAGNAADTKVGYGKQCFAVKSQCVQGQYQEWQTSEGEEGCSCKKL